MALNAISLLGLPGCGKGTQSILLASRRGYTLWGMGKYIRSGAMQGTDEEKRMTEELIAGGNLLPDWLSKRIMRSAMGDLANIKPSPSVLLDGFPRSIAQAMFLPQVLSEVDGTLDAVIIIDIDKSEILDRLLNRIVCKNCGEAIMRGMDVCMLCGSEEFVKRIDDDADVIKKRVESGALALRSLVDYYKSSSPSALRIVNGSGGEEDVYSRIVEIIT